jgi:hypothetical protein
VRLLVLDINFRNILSIYEIILKDGVIKSLHFAKNVD